MLVNGEGYRARDKGKVAVTPRNLQECLAGTRRRKRKPDRNQKLVRLDRRSHGMEKEFGRRYLAIATPGLFGPDYFHEVGGVLAASAGGPPDLAAVAEVMRRHGLTPVQPVVS